MKPVLTAAEMGEVDATAQRAVGIEVFIERAGTAVAAAAIRLLGGAYAKQVVVVAGRGHNGDDGRVAAARLARRGAAVRVLDASTAPEHLEDADLVIDAAYGTGFHGEYRAPRRPPGARVLAVDIASGVVADTGEAAEGAVVADATVTFGALKPGLLLGAGPAHCGAVEVAPIGLDVGCPPIHLLEDADVATLATRRGREAHKWQRAVYVVAGSPGMLGAAAFCATGALRAGAGMVRLGSPGAAPGSVPVLEAVARDLPPEGWARAVLAEVARCRALVVGPGLGSAGAVRESVLMLLEHADVPMLLDADGLNALGPIDEVGPLLARRSAPLVLTPHDGEFARLAGGPPGADRIAAARSLAQRAHAVVLLKGSTTVVAAPSGAVLLAASGSARLATAGTGDVLSGVIGAFLARGLDAPEAAALGAHVHGRAAGRADELDEGLIASDLPVRIAAVLAEAR